VSVLFSFLLRLSVCLSDHPSLSSPLPRHGSPSPPAATASWAARRTARRTTILPRRTTPRSHDGPASRRPLWRTSSIPTPHGPLPSPRMDRAQGTRWHGLLLQCRHWTEFLGQTNSTSIACWCTRNASSPRCPALSPRISSWTSATSTTWSYGCSARSRARRLRINQRFQGRSPNDNQEIQEGQERKSS